MDVRLSAVFRLFRIRPVCAGQVHRRENARSEQSQLQISRDHKLSTSDGHFNRIHTCLRNTFVVHSFHSFPQEYISLLFVIEGL